MKAKKNLDIRAWIVGHGLTYSEVAKEIPLSNSGFSSMLQRELAKKEKQEIIQAAKRALLKRERGISDEEGVLADREKTLLP